MNRRTFNCKGALAVIGTSLATTLVYSAEDGKIGKMDAAEFQKSNLDGGAQVKGLTPSSTPLSEDDTKLILQIAAGGMMQLEAGKLAVQKATGKDVQAIAKAEVEEQTVLGAKLKEFAAAKKFTLPEAAAKKTGKLLEKLQEKTGIEFDRAYLEESGIKGHRMLQETMTKVQDKAQDADLKKLAMTVLPLITIHLQVATDEKSTLS